MALTFRFGPHSWCEESIARANGYKRYEGPAPVARSPRPAASAPKPATQQAVARVPPPRSLLPPAPPPSTTPPVYMRPDEMCAERAKLEDWMVKVAALSMSRAEAAVYDEVKYRADELYALERMSR